ncbi:hypothetical protein KFL_000660120 [Klebsormidium nitens]|uniref:YbaK/aminoacyl-tRNA synthetase-associated domain-containing protein n=1 Tax=Klebsormidium nitens TaxID=105231 RepID=A0A1Y1HYI0_KLENI|nr:hypothetical protein KFL_000660120 [Klebsormidium nitens]|eukprot:GAQ80918.1 hypothetical protein KFL_000660120 [Klebsormidium nitens]
MRENAAKGTQDAEAASRQKSPPDLRDSVGRHVDLAAVSTIERPDHAGTSQDEAQTKRDISEQFTRSETGANGLQSEAPKIALPVDKGSESNGAAAKPDGLSAHTNAEEGETSCTTRQRLEKICRSLGCQTVRFKAVPEDYYERSLEERRDLLGAPSVDHLCKSIVMTNTQAPADVVNCSNPRNSKYYVVVVQYVAKLNTEKLKNFVYGLNEGKLPKKRINMRLAPSEVSDELTGYTHNSVTPFGMRTDIPVILSDAITTLSPPFFWLGAGEVDLKLGLEVSEFVDAIKPFIADCT